MPFRQMSTTQYCHLDLFIYLFILRLERNTETSSLILKMAEILSQVQQYLPRDCCSPDDPINSVVTER